MLLLNSQGLWDKFGWQRLFSTAANGFDRVIAGNKIFAQRTALREPELLDKLGKGQSPEVLWLGCADSRIPETTICDCRPGDIFVHRNIANVIGPDDLNSASVIEYSVGFLKVQRIIVCGHTKCGGANAALGDDDLGETLNKWLGPLRALRKEHQPELEKLDNADDKANRLAELNVFRSLEVVKANKTVQQAMKERGLTVHGVIYDIPAGELRELRQEQSAHALPALARAA
jgi:carbonic anhydrase